MNQDIGPSPQQQKRLIFKNHLRRGVGMVMIVNLIIITITSILKMPQLYDALIPLYKIVSFPLLSYIHDYCGLLFVVVTLVHILLSWGRLQFLMKRRYVRHVIMPHHSEPIQHLHTEQSKIEQNQIRSYL
jgi:hypothetical protein